MRPANDTKHPNQIAMTAAVSRWVAEAADKPNAVGALQGRIEWLERQSAIVSGPGRTPSHLVGLSAWEFTIAIGKLVGAVNAHRHGAEEAA